MMSSFWFWWWKWKGIREQTIKKSVVQGKVAAVSYFMKLLYCRAIPCMFLQPAFWFLCLRANEACLYYLSNLFGEKMVHVIFKTTLNQTGPRGFSWVRSNNLQSNERAFQEKQRLLQPQRVALWRPWSKKETSRGMQILWGPKISVWTNKS